MSEAAPPGLTGHFFDTAREDRRITSTTLPSSDGVEVALFDLSGDFKPDSRPLVVLAHATGMSGRVYLPITDRWPDLHCLAPDLRGHGDSTSPSDRHYAWRGFRHDLEAVTTCSDFRQLSTDRVFAFGHSMGAAALIMVELEHPGTFDGIFAFEPIILPPEVRKRRGDSPMVESARRRRSRFPSRLAAHQNYASKPPLNSLAPEALDAYVRYCFALQEDGSVRIKLPGEEEGAVYSMSGSHDTFDSLAAVQCPVCVAHGRIEPLSAASWAPRIAERLSNATVLPFPDLGHFGPLEDPAAVARTAEDFFSSIAGSR